MHYELKNCCNGAPAEYISTVDITRDGDEVTFFFHSENTEYYCPFDYYNGIHSFGDASEILIGTDPERKLYYEIECLCGAQDEIRAEAIKEFAERLCEGRVSNDPVVISTKCIVKEMTEGKK